MKNKIDKLIETKEELVKEISQKDKAILELSKYYDVSKFNIM